MKIIDYIKHEVSSKRITSTGLTGFKNLDLNLEKNGCAIIENFITEESCFHLIETAKETIISNKESLKSESNGSDTRIYGIDKINKNYELKNETKLLNKWAEKFYKSNDLKYFQMLGHITFKSGNLGSGSGWHRDSPFSHQFKFILYLNDVNESNGPFQYICGTHKEESIYKYSSKLNVKLSKFRYSELEIDVISKEFPELKIVDITGKAGTLLIADVKGLHRGKPLESGERWATTRYYFDKKIPSHLLSV